MAKVTSRISKAGEVSHRWAAFLQPSVGISLDEALNESLVMLADGFAFADYPADGQYERYAGFVVQQRYQCKMDRGGLADHGVGRTGLEEIEQDGP
jgi:hypothetical protein